MALAAQVSTTREWLARLFRPVEPRRLGVEEQFDYQQFLLRARQMLWIKAVVNALIVLLFVFTVLYDWPYTVVVAAVDGLLLIPYAFLVRRWPALSTLVLLTLAAVSISAADAASGHQTFTSGVLYAIIIVAGAVVLIDPRSTLVLTTAVTAVFVATYLVEITGVVPVAMTLLSPRAVVRVLGLHVVSFLGVGLISNVLTRLYRELLQTRSQQDMQSALREGLQEIAANLELDTVLQRIADRAIATIPTVDRAMLLLQEQDQFVIRGAAGYGTLDLVGGILPLEAGDEEYLGSPTVLTDASRRLAQLTAGDGQKSMQALTPGQATLLVPIYIEEGLHVVLAVTNTRRANAFRSDIVQVVELFAHQAAVAIKNARLYAVVRSRLQEEIAMNRIGRDVAGMLRMPELVPAIHKHVQEVMDAPSFAIALQRAAAGSLELLSPIDASQVFPDRVVSAEGIAGWVIRNRRPLRLGSLPEQLEAYPDIQPQPYGRVDLMPRSLLSVPLWGGDQVIGAMTVQSLHPQAYGEREEQFVSSLANFVAVAVQNARLYDQVAQKQHELQGLIMGVSRRLQGPAEALVGFSRLLKSRTDLLTDEESDWQERIERNSRQIAQMVQDMLFRSRLEQLGEEREPIPLGTLVQGVCAHLEMDQQGSCPTVQPDLPTLYADPVLLWGFFVNLFKNLQHLAPEDGELGIEIGGTDVPEGYRLYVRGSGQALSPEELAHAFDLFFPVGRVEGGGLGLAIAQRIAQRYGSRVWAESEPGQGTTIYAVLPQEMVGRKEGP